MKDYVTFMGGHWGIFRDAWVVTGVYFVMLVYSGYVSRVDCRTAVAAFKNSKKWAGYSAI